MYTYTQGLPTSTHSTFAGGHMHGYVGGERIPSQLQTTSSANQWCVYTQVESTETHRATPEECHRYSNPQGQLRRQQHLNEL